MNELSLEAYIKSWTKPNAYQICFDMDERLEVNLQKLVDEVIFAKDLKRSLIALADVFIKIIKDRRKELQNLDKGIGGSFRNLINVDDLDDLIYLVFGRFISGGFDLACFKSCWNEFFEAYLTSGRTGAFKILEKYQDMKCGKMGNAPIPPDFELPQNIQPN